MRGYSIPKQIAIANDSPASQVPIDIKMEQYNPGYWGNAYNLIEQAKRRVEAQKMAAINAASKTYISAPNVSTASKYINPEQKQAIVNRDIEREKERSANEWSEENTPKIIGAGLGIGALAALPHLAPSVMPWLNAGFAAYEGSNALEDIAQGNYLEAAGHGVMGALPYTSSIYKGAKALPEYLTTQNPLKNAWKLNPYRFKEDIDFLYRGLGSRGYKDAVSTNSLRAFGDIYDGNVYTATKFNIARPYMKDAKMAVFKENNSGSIDIDFVAPSGYDNREYFAAIPKSAIKNEVKGIVPDYYAIVNKGPISLDDGVKLYKTDWLKGFKEIPINNSNNLALPYSHNPMGQELRKSMIDKYGIEFMDYLESNELLKKAGPHMGWKFLDEVDYAITKSGGDAKDYQNASEKLKNLWNKYTSEVKDYYNSPKFEERFNKSFGNLRNIDDYKEETLGNLERDPIIKNSAVDLSKESAHYKSSKYNQLGKDIFSENEPYGHSYFNSKLIDEENVFHEGGHQLTNSNEALPIHLTSKFITDNLAHPNVIPNIKLENGLTLKEYYTMPTEFKTRLDLLRQDLKQVGYNYKTDDLTIDMLEKFTGKSAGKVKKEMYGDRKMSDLSEDEVNKFLDAVNAQDKYKRSRGVDNLLSYFPRQFIVDQNNILPSALVGVGSLGLFSKYNKK